MNRTRQQEPFQPRVVFETRPDLNQITGLVNNSLKIQSLESHTLTVSSPDILARLRGKMKWARPDQFQLEAFLGSKLTGTALGAGSNSEQFWFQVARPDPRLYFARHDEFDQHAGPRTILPVSPLWLREAMGVIEFDPSFSTEGPIERADGNLEIRSYIPSRRGNYRRHVVLEAKTGLILETVLYDHNGRLVAASTMSEHEYYTAIDFSLPHHVDIRLLPDGTPPIQFSVEIGSYLVNQIGENEYGSFQMPDARGLTQVNLVQFNSGLGSTVEPPKYTSEPPNYQSANDRFERMR